MNVIFLPRRGINLFRTLHDSETSRLILRFYHPVEVPEGVRITVGSIGSGLSVAGELRWYIRRYMEDVLFETCEGVFCTLALTRKIYYDREIDPDGPWEFRRIYVIRRGSLLSAGPLEQEDEGPEVQEPLPGTRNCIARCTEEEYLAPPKGISSGGDSDAEKPDGE